MLMFLTRMGHGSKMIVTGDDSQVDLPEGLPSGLLDAMGRLAGIKGLAFVHLDRQDIVRHRLVQNIVEAYASRGTAGASRTARRSARKDRPAPPPEAQEGSGLPTPENR
jgi:phosphate starvation-inducible PhoH-like protein